MAPNMHLFDLMKEKKMEKALKKDIRVKRLQAEVMNKKGIKVALYSASLLLEENLSVAEAAKVIGEHHDGTNQRKKSESDGVRNSKRSPSHEEKSPSRKGNSPVKEKNTVDSAEVVAVVTKMVQTLVPSIVEGVLVELEKETKQDNAPKKEAFPPLKERRLSIAAPAG